MRRGDFPRGRPGAPDLPCETLRSMVDNLLLCSAKGCRRPAGWALRWEQSQLHPPERRKTWLACDSHKDHLSAFLAARNFLREVEPVT